MPFGHFSRHPDTLLPHFSPRCRSPRPTPERVLVDFPGQFPRHGNLGQFERDVAPDGTPFIAPPHSSPFKSSGFSRRQRADSGQNGVAWCSRCHPSLRTPMPPSALPGLVPEFGCGMGQDARFAYQRVVSATTRDTCAKGGSGGRPPTCHGKEAHDRPRQARQMRFAGGQGLNAIAFCDIPATETRENLTGQPTMSAENM